MDKLVAQYSRPPHQNELYNEQEQEDLSASVPPLSLKFSLPPVDNVSYK
jgi:20S proteasome subunit beta 5